MIESPQIVETPAQWVAALHVEVPRSEMQQVMGPGVREAMAAVKTQGLGPTGPWFVHHLKLAPAFFDFDICVPVSDPLTAIGRVRPWQRPAFKGVRAIYQGPYEGLGAAWHELGLWVTMNGLKTASDLYECYWVGPDSSPNPADWRTELSRELIEQRP